MSITPISINTFFDKIFIINLEHRKDRWDECQEILKKHKITNFERFTAICPEYKSIDRKHYNRLVVNQREWYVTGAVGCKLSHLGVIKLAKSRGYNNFLVLEDDFSIDYLEEEFKSIFTNAILELYNPNTNTNTNTWDMLYLGGNNLIKPNKLDNNQLLHRAIKINTTHAYAMNNSIFDRCINEIENCGTEIDDYYKNNIQNIPELNVFCIFPSLIKQRRSVSDIFKGSVMKYDFD